MMVMSAAATPCPVQSAAATILTPSESPTRRSHRSRSPWAEDEAVPERLEADRFAQMAFGGPRSGLARAFSCQGSPASMMVPEFLGFAPMYSMRVSDARDEDEPDDAKGYS